MTSTETQRIERRQDRAGLGIHHSAFPSERSALQAPSTFDQPHAVRSGVPLSKPESDPIPCGSSCATHELNLCAKVGEKAMETGWLAHAAGLASTTQTVPARKTIWHPKEWSEYIPIVCQGWASSALTLPDGRRQILSFVLQGDLVSTVGLLGSMSGRAVEAITEVTYRKFKRSELKEFCFGNPDLLETLSNAWVEERLEADQLALDLGRRSADERIARLILKLAKRLTKRGMMTGATMEFPLRQRHIADATGLTPVHVSKVMGEFQRTDLIGISGRSLTIINETELHRVADWR